MFYKSFQKLGLVHLNPLEMDYGTCPPPPVSLSFKKGPGLEANPSQYTE